MNEGKSMGMPNVPRFAEIMQAPAALRFPRFGQPAENQGLTLFPMNYKDEIGRRIRQAREDKNWTLADVAQRTGDVLTLKRINAYENGDRMPGPAETVILSKALGVRAAYLMAIDDTQIPISPQEEALIRNWRTLSERDRMAHFRQIEIAAVQSRDPVADQVAAMRMPPPPSGGARVPKVAVHRKVRRRTDEEGQK